MEIPEQIWLLIARNLSGEASEREQEELAEILRNDEQLHQHYDLLTRIWIEKQSNLQREDSASARNIVSRILAKAEKSQDNDQDERVLPVFGSQSRLYRRKIWMAVASVIIIAFSGWLWLGKQSSGTQDKRQDIIEAHKGSRTRSVLADGSTVWLNAGSKLYYENDFSGATREVRLEGEAFFDIVKKPDHPFIVHTSGIDIKVLGTSFNVKSYPEDKTVETTLYRGSVKVFRHEETEKKAIPLKPNEKLILSKEAAIGVESLSDQSKPSTSAKAVPAISTIAHIDSTKKENERIETAWVYNRLEIRGESFEEMARKLERWYNITVTFTDEKAKELFFTGTFEGETIDRVFAYLKVANPLFTYKINNHEIFVGSAK